MTLYCQACNEDKTEFVESDMKTCTLCGCKFLPCCTSDEDDNEDICINCEELEEEEYEDEEEDDEDSDELMDRLEDDIDRDEEESNGEEDE